MIKPPEDFLSVLNARSQEIFRKIVERYLETGSPIGSRDLSRMLEVGLSPASVRNVMADLEDLGLIAAPHTSAGRAPTQEGLRFFVDAMLEVGAVDERERDQIARSIQDRQRGQVEDVLTEASQLLSGLSQGAGVVIATKSDMVLRHLEFVRLDATQAMAILVGADGQVENRLMPLPAGLTASALQQASNYLAHHVVGRTISEARRSLAEQRAQQRAELDELTQKLVDDGIATLSQPSSIASQPTVIVRGRANLINDAMASDDLARMRQLFDELESKDGLLELLGDAEEAQGVRIFIGSENKLFSLSGSSVILSPYKDANDKVVGVLGVIGPTRLNYARIVPVVDYTANVITAMLARKRGGG
ncbi:heat-inducible transcriptional repressor HrcA [Devosia sp. RR2S18]|jgi:heat-inducible transcriptional repressor|uniref:heat-inducible transcriptional repressor HrcA n=1 Tax=Devosia rhizosphaerae TaxID=3049774 RepID=UPI002541803D|nr:heat-inducible transcriptional repressor HrcA [Devosia sp. RR2S18]WIJ25358.1 heat-inducible transcriptional repressor HrcA [Devosia sp. RR2S18]HEV7291941.1 heat-inducible transcriptional repressor HrcA [Devosia sp.]